MSIRKTLYSEEKYLGKCLRSVYRSGPSVSQVGVANAGQGIQRSGAVHKVRRGQREGVREGVTGGGVQEHVMSQFKKIVHTSIHPLLHGLSARRCPMSP